MAKAVSTDQMNWLKSNAVNIMQALQIYCTKRVICGECPFVAVCDSYEKKYDGELLDEIKLKEVS